MSRCANRALLISLGALTTLGLVVAAAAPAGAASLVSSSTAQAVSGNIAGALNLAVSSSPTAADNDGTGSNTAADNQPNASLLGGQSLLGAGALEETAEANTDGSSYACAGVASPGGGVQVGSGGTTCVATGNGTGGVTVDLGALPGLGGLTALAGGDIKITLDSVTAHAFESGTDPATLGAQVANVKARVGTGPSVTVNISAAPNQDLLGAVITALNPQLGLAGTAVSNLLTGALSLTTNYQPAPEPSGTGVYRVSGLHVAVLSGAGTTADLARVTVGPNVQVAAVNAVSFQSLPVVFGGLAVLLLLGFGVRSGARRVRALV